MKNQMHLHKFHFIFLQPGALLCCTLLLGLIAGTAFSIIFAYKYSNYFYPVIQEQNPFFSRLIIIFFPFLLSAYFVCVKKPNLIFFLCFAKAFCFALCGHFIFQSYGSAGWLARILLQFSEICTVPLLFLYWFRSFTCNANAFKKELLIYFILVAFVTSFDYFIVSPLGAIL